jgi:diketogulonate reductase-like aldo/keto reductase
LQSHELARHVVGTGHRVDVERCREQLEAVTESVLPRQPAGDREWIQAAGGRSCHGVLEVDATFARSGRPRDTYRSCPAPPATSTESWPTEFFALPNDPHAAGLTRKQVLNAALALAAGAILQLPARSQPAQAAKMNTRPIPSTHEALPVIGCGTYLGFDQAPGSAEYTLLPGVVEALLDAGGKVIDSSPMYGRAEETTGELLAANGRRGEAFIATKVWTLGQSAGIRQMEESMRLLRTDRIDLMQIHNLLDWRTHLATLRAWKESGRIRYIGITHYTSSAYAEVESVLRAEKLDFLQIDYALDDREAERRVLPLAAERGVAVIVNRPFGGGELLRSLHDKPLPSWATEIGCKTWAQVLLKFVLSHPVVTCAIPGTRRREHMEDDTKAGLGPVPSLDFWNDKLAAVER